VSNAKGAEASADGAARTREISVGALLFAAAVLHLSSGHPFQRKLIDLDDRALVGGLESVSLSGYFTDRMWRPDVLAFPVRDLTYLFDHALVHELGVQTFVLTSVLLFIGYALLVERWFRRSIPLAAALPMLAVVVMHPINVEVIQWAISRKHLLVGIFTILAVLRVDHMRETAHRITWKDWGALVALGVASSLSHPTGVLFPLWAAGVLLARCRRDRLTGALVAYVLITLVASLLWLRHAEGENADYRGLTVQTGYVVEGIGEQLRYLMLALGRGTWQLLVPSEQAIYFDIDSWRNTAGLVLLAGALVGLATMIAVAARSGDEAGRTRLRSSAECFALALLLFVPEAFFVMRRSDFVMADRFLFLSLPYLLAGIWHLLAAARFPRITSPSMTTGATVSAVLAGLLAIPSAKAAPRWRSERALYESCVENEGADRCWFHEAAKLHEAGCWEVARRFPALEAALKAAASRKRSLYLPEGAYVLSLCQATVLGKSVEARWQDLDDLARLGATDEALSMGRNLLDIERGRAVDAMLRAVALFLSPSPVTAHMNQDIVGAELGQLEVLGEADSVRRKGGAAVAATFQARFGSQVEPAAVAVGRQLTLQAFDREQRGSGAAGTAAKSE
jgi:hypothetical protein